MVVSKLVGLVFEAWNDLDRVVGSLSSADAVATTGGESSFGWTVAHVTNQLDAWVNVRFAGRGPHPLLSQERYRMGAAGVIESWEDVCQAVSEARAAARLYLDRLTDDQLGLTLPYDGSLPELRVAGLSLQYALLRIAAHHYFHIGEIANKRDRLGHQVGDYPGPLRSCL